MPKHTTDANSNHSGKLLPRCVRELSTHTDRYIPLLSLAPSIPILLHHFLLSKLSLLRAHGPRCRSNFASGKTEQKNCNTALRSIAVQIPWTGFMFSECGGSFPSLSCWASPSHTDQTKAMSKTCSRSTRHVARESTKTVLRQPRALQASTAVVIVVPRLR